MKINALHIVIVSLIVWNVVLSLPSKKNQIEPINYELLEQVYQKSIERHAEAMEQINQLKHEITKDSIFVVSANRSERDSLRAILNPRR